MVQGGYEKHLSGPPLRHRKEGCQGGCAGRWGAEAAQKGAKSTWVEEPAWPEACWGIVSVMCPEQRAVTAHKMR